MTNLAGIESILEEHQARYGKQNRCPTALGRLQSKLTRAGLPLEPCHLNQWVQRQRRRGSYRQSLDLHQT
ncbi:MAG: hypothetical protein RL539_1269 [Pseudomonadota bacterium]